MTLHGDYGCTIPKSRMLDWYGSGELKFECAKCQRDIYIKDLKETFVVGGGESEGQHEKP